MLDTDALLFDLKEFGFGWLPDEQVRAKGGHGCAFLAPLPPEAEGFAPTFAVGPRREMLLGHAQFIAPHGDMMIAGCHGMPILRYRTRDLTRIIPGDCPCGRKHRRIDRILGRSDDMIIVKGVNIYPMQVERVLMAYPEVGQNYVIVLERDGLKDTMKVQVEIREESFVEDMRVLRGLQETIARALKDEILITPKVELVQHNSLPRTEGKAQRVIDKREKS